MSENEFENKVQDQTNDFVPAAAGFIFSFLFFTIIFAVGVAVSVVAR